MRQKRKTRDREGARRKAKRGANSAPETAGQAAPETAPETVDDQGVSGADQDVGASDPPEGEEPEAGQASESQEPEAGQASESQEPEAGQASESQDEATEREASEGEPSDSQGHVSESEDEPTEREASESQDEAMEGEPSDSRDDVSAGEDEAGEDGAGEDDAAVGGVGRLKSVVESLLFASDKPLTVKRIAQLTRERDHARIQDALTELAADYEGRGIVLHDVAGGWQLRTAPQNSHWVQQLVAGRPVRLTRAQLETLAIIAYRQPITRPEIDDIRGVDSGGTLRVLLERQLIRVLGKKEEPGRPLLYGTTKEFLEFFNLNDLRDLPTLREYHELTEDSMRMVERLSEKLPPGHEAAADGEDDAERAGAGAASDGTSEADAGGAADDGLASAEGSADEQALDETSGEDAPSEEPLSDEPAADHVDSHDDSGDEPAADHVDSHDDSGDEALDPANVDEAGVDEAPDAETSDAEASDAEASDDEASDDEASAADDSETQAGASE